MIMKMVNAILQLVHSVNEATKEIKTMAAGLNALTQAVQDLTDGVSKAVQTIADAVGQLNQSEDPQVLALAGQIEGQVKALNDALAPLQPANPAPTPQPLSPLQASMARRAQPDVPPPPPADSITDPSIVTDTPVSLVPEAVDDKPSITPKSARSR